MCSANICRSAISMAILKKMILEKCLQNFFVVNSAGVEALIEAPPDTTTIAVCKNHGIDITSHRGQQVTHAMIHDASLVLCMSESHRRIIRGIFPEWEKKILLLKEFGQAELPRNLSIADPTGRSKRKYEQCFKEIESEINRIFPILEEISLQKKKLHKR